MNEVWPEIEGNAIREAEAAAMLLLFPPARAVDLIPLVEASWAAGDLLRVIRYWVRVAEEEAIMLHLPGADTFSEEMLRTVGTLTGYTIRRACDRDTLYVEAKP